MGATGSQLSYSPELGPADRELIRFGASPPPLDASEEGWSQEAFDRAVDWAYAGARQPQGGWTETARASRFFAVVNARALAYLRSGAFEGRGWEAACKAGCELWLRIGELAEAQRGERSKGGHHAPTRSMPPRRGVP